MLFSIDTLRKQVIQPCLAYLDIHVENFDCFLASIILCSSAQDDGLGAFHISHQQHWDLWDNFLVNNPALASKIRGLASQHRFLDDPDNELNFNMGYAIAIAAFLILRELPTQGLRTAHLISAWSIISPTTNTVQLEQAFGMMISKNSEKVA